MKILFIGDAHIKINNFQIGLQFLSWVNQLVETKRPDLVVNLGDFFDNHAVVRSEVMTEFMRHVDHVLGLKIPYVYLCGNHDFYKPNDSKYHAVKHLVDKIPNLYVVDRTQDLFDITFVPYQPDPNKFPRKTQSICVAHQTFKGADYGDITTNDGVDAQGIAGCDCIIAGHIHVRGILTPPWGVLDRLDTSGVQVIYIGSPFSQGVVDINQTKGVTLFDTATLREEFIASPLPMWRGDKFTIEAGFTADNMHEYLVANLPDTKDHWVIDMTGPKAEINDYLSSSRYKTMIKGIDIRVRTTFTDRDKKLIRIDSLLIDDIVTQYIAKVYSGSLDKKILGEKALEILRSIKAQ